MDRRPSTPQTRNITLGFMSPGDTRQARTVRLMIQDADFQVLTLVDLSEHDFTALMAGQSVRVEAEI